MNNDLSLDNVLTLTNQKASARLLTEGNFEVMSIRPVHGTSFPHNTDVTIRVDLFEGLNKDNIKDEERYVEQTISIKRLSLTEALRHVKVPEADGIFDISYEELKTKINISDDEVVIRTSGDAVIVSAKKDSLGFTGGVKLKA